MCHGDGIGQAGPCWRADTSPFRGEKLNKSLAISFSFLTRRGKQMLEGSAGRFEPICSSALFFAQTAKNVAALLGTQTVMKRKPKGAESEWARNLESHFSHVM